MNFVGFVKHFFAWSNLSYLQSFKWTVLNVIIFNGMWKRYSLHLVKRSCNSNVKYRMTRTIIMLTSLKDRKTLWLIYSSGIHFITAIFPFIIDCLAIFYIRLSSSIEINIELRYLCVECVSWLKLNNWLPGYLNVLMSLTHNRQVFLYLSHFHGSSHIPFFSNKRTDLTVNICLIYKPLLI